MNIGLTRTLAAAAIFVIAAACQSFGQTAAALPQETFWNELTKLCGKAFKGTVVVDTTGDERFKDKAMVMHVRSCEKDRIRVPFMVGDDRSRTWILTRKKGRIELRHDHRHEDGKPDAVTMYGGWTVSDGMPTRQMFPADQDTVKVVAAAATNVWWMDLVAGEHFSYNLRRMGSERVFSVKFDLKTEVAAPPAPWGWKD
ncbi:MAG: hypothetical protein AB7Q37_02505 [Pyrinomonadaceae bacterium]